MPMTLLYREVENEGLVFALEGEAHHVARIREDIEKSRTWRSSGLGSAAGLFRDRPTASTTVADDGSRERRVLWRTTGRRRGSWMQI